MSRLIRRLALVCLVATAAAVFASATAEAGVVAFVARPIIGRPILARRAYLSPTFIPPGLQPLPPVVVYQQPLLLRRFIY